jgi:hypothetical protein
MVRVNFKGKTIFDSLCSLNKFSKCLKHFQYFVFNSTSDWVPQTLLKFKCQLKLNWDLNLLEMYIELIYT